MVCYNPSSPTWKRVIIFCAWPNPSIDVRGKGAKDRAVPIKAALAANIAAWGKEIEFEGFVLCLYVKRSGR